MLLEREGQLERLVRFLHQAQEKRGRLVALVGEAGVGKTSLVEAFARMAEPWARVLRSACEDLSIPEPLGPLYDLARAARWDIVSGEENGSRLRLFSQALHVFSEAEQPTLIIVEDIHWADDASLDLVKFIGRRIAQTNILLVLTARNEGIDGQRRVRRALAEIPREAVVRMDVPLLSEAAVSLIAAGSGLDAASLFHATGGNAFFATELIESGSVRDAVLLRAEGLAPEARLVLDAASVFPRRVEVSVLLGMLGAGGSQALGRCLSAGLLTATPEHVNFRHEIARQAVEASLADSDRQALNNKALEALRAMPSVPAARLVHHAREARHAMLVRALAPAAASEASALGSHWEAAGLLAAALDGETLGDRAGLLVRLAVENYLIGRTDTALAHLEEARGRFVRSGDGLNEGDCLRWISRLSYLAGDRVSAEASAAAAVACLSGHAPGPELAMGLSNLSQLAMLADHVEETLHHGRAAVELASRLGRRDISCHALNNIGSIGKWISLDAARGPLGESLEMALADDMQEHTARAYTNLACCLIDWREHGEAERMLSAGIGYCVERDLDTWRDSTCGPGRPNSC